MTDGYEVLGTETVLESPWVTVRKERISTDGHETDYYTATRGDGVMVLAVTGDGEAVLVREYQHGCRSFVLQLPRGGMIAGESLVETARRELLEETGYSGREFRYLGAVYIDPVWSPDRLHLFATVDAERVAEPERDDTELMEVELLGLGEAVEMALNGEIDDPYTIATLLRGNYHD